MTREALPGACDLPARSLLRVLDRLDETPGVTSSLQTRRPGQPNPAHAFAPTVELRREGLGHCPSAQSASRSQPEIAQRASYANAHMHIPPRVGESLVLPFRRVGHQVDVHAFGGAFVGPSGLNSYSHAAL